MHNLGTFILLIPLSSFTLVDFRWVVAQLPQVDKLLKELLMAPSLSRRCGNSFGLGSDKGEYNNKGQYKVRGPITMGGLKDLPLEYTTELTQQILFCVAKTVVVSYQDYDQVTKDG